jgi:hypothetical protein
MHFLLEGNEAHCFPSNMGSLGGVLQDHIKRFMRSLASQHPVCSHSFSI